MTEKENRKIEEIIEMDAVDDGINGIADDVEELTEDIDNIGADTDEILKRISTTLQELSRNTVQTKETKRWVISLFLVDKVVMFIIILLTLKYGVN